MIWCVVVKVSCYFLLLSMEKSVLLRQERVKFTELVSIKQHADQLRRAFPLHLFFALTYSVHLVFGKIRRIRKRPPTYGISIFPRYLRNFF